MGNIKYNDVIRSISYDQHEILYNIMKMHNNGKPFDCDITYSTGKFYGKFNVETLDGNKVEIEIPQPKFKFDVCPQSNDVVQIEDGKLLPLDDNSISSIVVDLPFVVSPHTAPSILNDNGDKKKNIIFKRFSSYYPWYTMPKSYSHWLNEAYRVLKNEGIVVFKTQSTISARKNIMMPYYSWMEAEKAGFYTLDEFILLAKNRLHSGKIKKTGTCKKISFTFLCIQEKCKRKTNKLL